MSYQLIVHTTDRFVELKHSGFEMTDDELSRRKVAEVLDENRWLRILVDIRDVKQLPPVARQFQFTQDNQHVLPKGVSLAMVMREDQETMGQFVENVAQNRGVNQRAFKNYESAKAWLIKN